MKRFLFFRCLFFALALAPLAGCGGGSSSVLPAPGPLAAGNINLIFVVSPDLAYQAPGDVDPATANLTNQGLQRTLLMGTFLKQQVLGARNVNGIYALQPMTHLQTANNYPDMAGLMTVQQFAMLNQIALPSAAEGTPMLTANSYPINTSYTPGSLPPGVAAPLPTAPCPSCRGLEFDDQAGNNVALVSAIVRAAVPGYYVFSAPWETTRALLESVNRLQGYSLPLPTRYRDPNYIYAISVAPSGDAGLVTYDSHLNPAPSYPALPSPVLGTSCASSPFKLSATGGVNGASIPAGANTNETLYMVRHAEAHPASGWDDGNYVAAGQWRALALANALRGKISPDVVYSIDPAQVIPNALAFAGGVDFSYVRPSLTVQPYAIANNLPYYLVSDFQLFDPNSPLATSNYFFTGGRFSNRTVLLAWEHAHFPPIVAALLGSYYRHGGAPPTPTWASADYDTIWTVTLDGNGNMTVTNALCEGIDSAALPATAPQF